MKALLKKELKGHYLLLLITLLISAFFQIMTAFGFYINAEMYKNSALVNIPKDQMKMLQNMLKLISSPDKFFSGTFLSGSLIVLIAMIVLGISLWNSEIKNHTAEFLFSSGTSHKKILLAKFAVGSIYVALITVILCYVSLFSGSVIYAKLASLSDVFSQIGMKLPAFFIPHAVFVFKLALMYFVGTELIFAVSFASAFAFFKKGWILKALVPVGVYLVWGILWNSLFGYPNPIAEKFHKGLILTSKTLYKFSLNTLYFSEQAAKASEMAFGIGVAVAVITGSIFFLFGLLCKRDKI